MLKTNRNLQKLWYDPTLSAIFGHLQMKNIYRGYLG